MNQTLDVNFLKTQNREILPCEFEAWPQERIEADLIRWAHQTPGRLAVVDPWRRLTYRELDIMTDDAARALYAAGVRPGAVILFQLPNVIEAAVIHQATLRVGAISLPVTPIYRERELTQIMQQVKPDFLFIMDNYRGYDYLDIWERVLRTISTPNVVVVHYPGGCDINVRDRIPWNRFVGSGRSAAELPPMSDDVMDYALLLFTSGTTSEPKGVLHSHATLKYSVMTLDGCEHLSADSVFFVPSPVTHISGITEGLEAPFYFGGCAVYIPQWRADQAFEMILRSECTYVMGATPFLSGLAEECENRYTHLDTLQYFACGGADIPQALVRRAQQTFPNCIVSRLYGSSEAPGISRFQDSDQSDKRYTCDGRIIHPSQARIRPVSGIPSSAGELEVQGPQLFLRYLDARATEEAFTPDGWFRTGDLAEMDEDAFIQIKGRMKDIIIRGGENFSAGEVEELLLQHPAIADVAVVGYPDPVFGERACAFVVPRSEGIGLSAMRSFLSQFNMAKQKWPERIELVDQLPRTPSGKVQKFILRRRLMEETTK